MKKFDIFLIFLAVSLIYLGYSFSQRFSISSVDVSQKSKKNYLSQTKQVLNRLPNQNQSSISKPEGQEPQVIKIEKEYIKKLVDFNKCIKSQDCDYPQDDPRSYELEIYKAMNEHIKNVDVLSPRMKEKVLMSAAKVSDGFVKETVLKKILEEQIYSDEWRDVILDEYISHYNSRLIPDAIEYLKMNSSFSDKVIINQRIAQELATGSPMVANALAENLKLLLDKNSVQFYKNYLSNLQEGPIKKSLSREINDYEMISSAG